MIDILVFLLILCILFGVEATRAFIFGAFGFIFWIIIILVFISLLAKLFKDDRTPEQKEASKKRLEAERKKQKEKAEQDKNPIATAGFYIIMALFIIAFICIFIFLK